MNTYTPSQHFTVCAWPYYHTTVVEYQKVCAESGCNNRAREHFRLIVASSSIGQTFTGHVFIGLAARLATAAFLLQRTAGAQLTPHGGVVRSAASARTVAAAGTTTIGAARAAPGAIAVPRSRQPIEPGSHPKVAQQQCSRICGLSNF